MVSCSYYILGCLLPLKAFGLNAINHPWTYLVSYVFPSPVLVPLVPSKILVEHVTGQFRPLILGVPCWMEAPWPPTVVNMLVNVPHWCAIIKHLVMDVSVGWVLKGLQLLHLTICLLKCGCCASKGLFFSLTGIGRGDLSIYGKSLPAVLQTLDQIVCLRWCTKQCFSCP